MMTPTWRINFLFNRRRIFATACFLSLLVVDGMVGAFYTFIYNKGAHRSARITSRSTHFGGLRTTHRVITLKGRSYCKLSMGETNGKPQVVVTGFSNLPELQAALEDAFRSAMGQIPSTTKQIDFALVSVSSLYDGSSSATPITAVVPVLLQKAMHGYNVDVLNLIGCTSAGLVSSLSFPAGENTSSSTTIETEGSLGVSITLCLLPDIEVRVCSYCFNALFS